MKHHSYQDYRLFRRSPALLWLKKFRPSQYEGLSSGRHNYSSGERFESLAAKAFYPAAQQNMVISAESNDCSIVARKPEVNDGEISTVPDILIFDEDGDCQVVEITSATSVKKSVLEKLALTGRSLSNLGISVSGYSVLYIDRFVPLQGDFDVRVMTRQQDVSLKVIELFESVAKTLQGMQSLEADIDEE